MTNLHSQFFAQNLEKEIKETEQKPDKLVNAFLDRSIEKEIYFAKLALSNDFDEIKSFAEKIGTNRRLLDRKLIFDFQKPFDFVPKYRQKCEPRTRTSSVRDKLRSAAGGANE